MAQQRDLLLKYGNNMTLTQKLQTEFSMLFPNSQNVSWDWPHVATIILEFESEEMVLQGIQVLKTWTPTWSPSFFMPDKSAEELNAQVHTEEVCLLCDFHQAQAQDR